jgi:malate/lactate dehydrogenase
MPEFTAEVEISEWEYVRECTDTEVENLIKEIQRQAEEIWEQEVSKWLIEFSPPHTSSLATTEFFEALQRISKNHLRLSLEQEEYILNLSKSL